MTGSVERLRRVVKNQISARAAVAALLVLAASAAG